MRTPSEAAMAHYVLQHSRSAMQLIVEVPFEGRGLVPSSTCRPVMARVARHLAAEFPKATLLACDIDSVAVQFCADQFGAIPVVTDGDLSRLSFDDVDLIWCGSLMSHLPRHIFLDAIRLFSRSLAPNGLAIFTTHGRHSTHYLRGRESPFR